jgi:micrococcal nuclease
MANYEEQDCSFIYNITAIEKIVDGDTLDAVIDLGFDVRYCGRVRLLGIDTPESRTSNKTEKVYGKISKHHLKEWCHWAVLSDRDDIELQVRCPEADSRGKFGRILGEIWISCTEDGHEFNGWTNINKWLCDNGYAVPYTGQNKNDVLDAHIENRKILAESGEQELLIDEVKAFEND